MPLPFYLLRRMQPMWKLLGVAFILAQPLPLSAQVAPSAESHPAAEVPACDARAPERSCHPAPSSQTGPASSLPPLGISQFDHQTKPLTQVAAAQIPRAAWPLLGCGVGAAIFGILSVFSDTRLSQAMLLGCVIGFGATAGASQQAGLR